ncbi:MAG TPA: protein kinase [Deinococcales bacterium]|nr:protein kinase [Deinococcales bacterium]
MTLFLLVIVFALSVFACLRLPQGALNWLVGGLGAALAVYELIVNLDAGVAGGVAQPGRAVAALTLAGLSLGITFAPTPRRRSRKGPARRPSPKSTVTGKRRAAPARKVEAGELANFERQDRVGIGGMASVYRAVRRSDHKVVALKIPQEKFVADAKFVRRFHREAEVLMRLNHQNIIKVFEHASEGSIHYIAMEFIEGDSLESLIESRRLSLQHSVEIMRLTGDALRYIHKQGIIHRDIKPGNIMVLKGALSADPEPRVDPNGVKLMDFGIAAGKVLTRLTMTGARVGTPVYMSPEQARGLKIDHRSDIYSLGLVFYEMVTGTTAFKGGYEAVVHQQIFQTPAPPRQVNLDVPQALNDLIMRMIEKDPDKRPTLTEVIAAIEGGLFEEQDVLSAPSQLVASVNARKGVVRLLDTRGNLERSLGTLGPDGYPVPPLAVAADADLNLFLSVFEHRAGDAGPNMIRKIAPDGRDLLSFGAHGLKPGEFLYPSGIAVSPAGQVFILDSETVTVQRFSLDGVYLGKFGGRGRGRGTFEDPRAVVASEQYVYVLDYGNRQVQRFTLAGEFMNRYSFRLNQESDELRVLDGIGVDPHGALLISEANGGKIRTLRPDGKQGQSYVVEPLQGEDTTATVDIGVDHEGFVYAARRGGHLIRKFAPDGGLVSTLETYAPIVALCVVLREKVLEPVRA